VKKKICLLRDREKGGKPRSQRKKKREKKKEMSSRGRKNHGHTFERKVAAREKEGSAEGRNRGPIGLLPGEKKALG